ncbi:hypothetical protein GCM10023144_36660 [Pigmentiphaga soli]|uniref:CoA transferase n=1 Tax=Pigmentiphaga soli TaxID=1007095 RepID=A0ABP8HGC8_9BURK
MMTKATALEGVVVIEAGGRGAVAVCGSLLAQMGATVVAIETPGHSPKAAHRAHYMAGKLSWRPDGGDARDRDMLARLLAQSDIVLASSDIDPAWLAPDMAHPRNVVCDITALGRNAASTDHPLSEMEVQALSGIMDTTGFPEEDPVPIRVPIVDAMTGGYAASAVLAAHRMRRRQGSGQVIDIAMFDAAFVALRSFLTSVLTSAGGDPSRLGNRHPTVRPWNLYRTTDGYVLICAGNTYAMFERLCRLIGRADIAPKYSTMKSRVAGTPEIDPAIEDWTSRFSTADCVERLLAVGVVAGPLVPVDDYPREANLDFREMILQTRDPVSGRSLFVSASPLRMDATPGVNLLRIPGIDGDRAEVERLSSRLEPAPAAAACASSGMKPLAGVRIVEFGQYTTAPLCARELAHLGAEVIKVEQPASAERIDTTITFRATNAGKKMLAIDLKNESDVELLTRLLATADVLLENLKPGTLAKFGFTPEALLKINPRLVYCPVSGFGTKSLYPTRPAFDMVITAMAGFMTVLSADGRPLKSGISTADLMGAIMATAAVLAALDHAQRTGEGQFIDLSMQDICAWLTQTAWNKALDGRVEPAVIKASDGYVFVEAGLPAFQQARARFPDLVPTQEAALDRTVADLTAALPRAGLHAVPVQTVRQAAMMPHTIERKLWSRKQEEGITAPILASPLRLPSTPSNIGRLASPIDHDRKEILAELGLPPPIDH